MKKHAGGIGLILLEFGGRNVGSQWREGEDEGLPVLSAGTRVVGGSVYLFRCLTTEAHRNLLAEYEYQDKISAQVLYAILHIVLIGPFISPCTPYSHHGPTTVLCQSAMSHGSLGCSALRPYKL